MMVRFGDSLPSLGGPTCNGLHLKTVVLAFNAIFGSD